MSSPQASARFPTTTWTALLAAKDGESPEAVAAMNRFISAYWRPIFCYLRARGKPLQDAEDLTQEFFLRFVERDWLAPLDPSRGRFRSFLLTLLSRFVADQSPKRAPRQNSFEQRLVPITALMGEKDRTFEPSDTETPEEVFMRQWARAVIRNIRRRLRIWCEDSGRPDWYRVFAAFNLDGGLGPRVTQEEVARKLGLTRDQVRYALQRTEEQFVGLLRAEIADQVGSSADTGEEIQELERLLG